MLYAEFDRKQMLLPIAWDKCEAMFMHLKQLTWGYQLIAERRMFQTPGPEYRCVLVKWSSGVSAAVMQDKKREVLLETSDPEQMEAALFMLINEAEAQAKAYRSHEWDTEAR